MQAATQKGWAWSLPTHRRTLAPELDITLTLGKHLAEDHTEVRGTPPVMVLLK